MLKLRLKNKSSLGQQQFVKMCYIVQGAGNYPVPGSFPKLSNVIRQTNKGREKNRPSHPKDINFVLEETNIPDDFLLDDICVGTARHLIFASLYQLQQLTKFIAGYTDRTYKLV